jgi:hypothetical protein
MLEMVEIAVILIGPSREFGTQLAWHIMGVIVFKLSPL